MAAAHLLPKLTVNESIHLSYVVRHEEISVILSTICLTIFLIALYACH